MRKKAPGPKRSPEHQRAVLERRRSGATRSRPSRAIKRKATRRDAKSAAISECR